MKKIFSILWILAAGSAAAQGNVTLDLTKATTPLDFNADNGAWTETYNENAGAISSQIFDFLHYGFLDYGMWWGFTASNSADNSRREDTITYQFSNMAQGGIVLDENGNVALDEFGDPMTSAEVPYLVAYYAAFMGDVPCAMTFSDGKSHEPVGVYVNLPSYPYYVIEEGDAFARRFRNGDRYTMTITGVADNNTTKDLEFTLASCENGVLNITRGWRYVDLSSLGAVNELRFRLATTDVGEWGDNTPEYFCLDKLTVKSDAVTSASSITGPDAITYDPASATVTAEGFVGLYNAAGQLVAGSESGRLDVAALPAGVYVARCGNASVKFAR